MKARSKKVRTLRETSLAWLNEYPKYREASDRIKELERARDRLTANLGEVCERLRKAGAREELEGEIDRLRLALERAEGKAGNLAAKSNELRAEIKRQRDSLVPWTLDGEGRTRPLVPANEDAETCPFERSAREWKAKANALAKELAEVEASVVEDPRDPIPASLAERLGLATREPSLLAELRSQRATLEADLREIGELIAGAEVVREALVEEAREFAAPVVAKKAEEARSTWRKALAEIRSAEAEFEKQIKPKRDKLAEVEASLRPLDQALFDLTH